MVLRVLGEHPFAIHRNGRLKSRIGTIFPDSGTIVTLPGIHATQRLDYLEDLDRRRQADGQCPLAREEQAGLWENAVDLILEKDAILIRPDPEKMPLAFVADEVLQEMVPKYKIRFLHLLNEKVRDSIKRRGECWRVNPLPKSPLEMAQMIASSRIGITRDEFYYYNKASGTRFLTYHEFARLGSLSDEELRAALLEIQKFSSRIGPRGNLEVAFFMSGEAFTKGDLAPHDFRTAEADQVRSIYGKLVARFHDAVAPEYRRDNPKDARWRNRMCASLLGQEDEAVSEETLLGLSPEFFMQIQWLPGGRVEDGEFIYDPIFDKPTDEPADPQLRRLRDENSRGFIFNFVREYGDLEYVNIGRVNESLSHRPVAQGRRDVYIAEVKERGTPHEIVSIIRMQKWGVWEHLNERKGLADAIMQSEQYTEYVLDRRLACRQLGMNVPLRVAAKKVSECYSGTNTEHRGAVVGSPYIEREYIRGIATDKISGFRFVDEEFAARCFRLLGLAAVGNIIVGRCDLVGSVLFDDGDEVVVESDDGMPIEIVVADQTGTLADYKRNLREVAGQYAKPITRRLRWLANPKRVAAIYLDAFVEKFLAIQNEYRRHTRAFDSLFQHRPRDEGGSLAYRWERILKRLDGTDPSELRQLIEADLDLE